MSLRCRSKAILRIEVAVSNALALATVTAVLEERVRYALAGSAMSGSVSVSSDHPKSAGAAGVFIKLIRISPHAQLMNNELPSWGSNPNPDGPPLQKPRIPLVLDYLCV